MSRSPEEVQARAALYALGVLPEDETHEFEFREREEDGQTAEVTAFEAVVKDLAYAVVGVDCVHCAGSNVSCQSR